MLNKIWIASSFVAVLSGVTLLLLLMFATIPEQLFLVLIINAMCSISVGAYGIKAWTNGITKQ